jgi:hypothetical protein
MKFSNPFKSKQSKKKEQQKKKSLSSKQTATNNNEPWVSVLDMDIDMANISNGSFELDWNDLFIARLIKSGYQGKTDADIVDQWFQNICRNIVMETYEQEQSDPNIRKVNLGNGRSEIS